jgi:hypothetical protein
MGLAILVVLLAGAAGRLSAGRHWVGLAAAVRGHRLRSAGLLGVAAVVLIAAPTASGSIDHAYPLAMMLGAALTGAFALRNRCVPGVPLVAIGVLLNALVVLGNNTMPIEARAAARAGVTTAPSPSDHRHEPADGGTRLRLLDGRVAVPIPLHREVDSLGDVAVAAGAGLCVFTALRRRRQVFDQTQSWTLQGAS